MAGMPYVRVCNIHFRPGEAKKPYLARTLLESLLMLCLKKQVRLFTGDINSAKLYFREIILAEQRKQDKSDNAFTFDYHVAHKDAEEIVLAVLNYPRMSGMTKWSFEPFKHFREFTAQDMGWECRSQLMEIHIVHLEV